MNFKVGDKVTIGTKTDYGIGTIVEINDYQADIYFKEKGIAETAHVNSIQSALTAIDLLRLRKFDDPIRFDLRTRATFLKFYANQSVLSNSVIEILPHQIMAAHKVVSAPYRRFLLADEVGLGKTFEAGIIIKELLCRGECESCLIITPAALVEQWQADMEKFALDFFAFQSQMGIAIKNFWAKNKFVIASIDTIKIDGQLKALDEVPLWDIIVFDEAHHLSRIDYAGKAHKSDRYRVAEKLHQKTRTLLFLTATPHQGDRSKFFNLIQLLSPGLFRDENEPLQNRNKLDQIMIRQRKIDVTDENGTPLFVKRIVALLPYENTEEEKTFIGFLNEYLIEGYKMSESIQDNRNRALGFVMVTFQKLAASSIFAVKKALENRLIRLLFMQLQKSEDESEKDRLKKEIIHYEKPLNLLASDDDIFFEAQNKFRKYLEENNVDPTEFVAIPHEIEYLKKLLLSVPEREDTKLIKLIEAIESIKSNDPKEKFIIFTEYLRTQDYIVNKLQQKYGVQDVVFLRGGSHQLKLEATRAFKEKAHFLVSTQAGGEGINLQHCHIVINYDMPWNPMKVEQRIGRAHRYGAKDTVQVYNLFATDTIEARIYQCLEEKLREISIAIGNLDKREAFRENILGIVAEELDFDKMYKDILIRGKEAVTVSEDTIRNAVDRAREVYLKLSDFTQNLEKFNLDKYRKAKGDFSLEDVEKFVLDFVRSEGKRVSTDDRGHYEFMIPKSVPYYGGQSYKSITFDRQEALGDGSLEFMALGHYLTDSIIGKCTGIDYGGRCTIRQMSCSEHKGELGAQFNFKIIYETAIPGQEANQILKRDFLMLFFDKEGIFRPELEGLGVLPSEKTVDATNFAFADNEFIRCVENAANEKLMEIIKETRADLDRRHNQVVYKVSLENVALFEVK